MEEFKMNKENNETESENKNTEEQSEVEYVPSAIVGNKLYEIVQIGGDTKFVYLDEQGNATYTERIKTNNREYAPLNGEEIMAGVVIIPTGVMEYQSVEELITSLKDYFKKYVDLSADMYELAAYYVLLTYAYDQLHQIVYLRFMGDIGCGKSRAQDVIGRVCYRPVCTQGGTSSAALFRMTQKLKGTVLIDEGDYRVSDEKADIAKYLNCGFQKGKSVIKCSTSNPDNLQYFDSYCPKIICTRREFEDKATESRCITEVMQETQRKDIPAILPKCFYQESEQLRNKLLFWRLRNWQLVNPDDALDFNIPEIEPRVKQAYSSLAIVIKPFPEAYSRFLTFVKAYSQRIIDDRASSTDGQIIGALFELWELQKEVTSQEISSRLENAVSAQKVGSTLKSLGLTTKPVKIKGKTMRIVLKDDAVLEKLRRRYGYNSYESYGCKEGNPEPCKA